MARSTISSDVILSFNAHKTRKMQQSSSPNCDDFQSHPFSSTNDMISSIPSPHMIASPGIARTPSISFSHQRYDHDTLEFDFDFDKPEVMEALRSEPITALSYSIDAKTHAILITTPQPIDKEPSLHQQQQHQQQQHQQQHQQHHHQEQQQIQLTDTQLTTLVDDFLTTPLYQSPLSDPMTTKLPDCLSHLLSDCDPALGVGKDSHARFNHQTIKSLVPDLKTHISLMDDLAEAKDNEPILDENQMSLELTRFAQLAFSGMDNTNWSRFNEMVQEAITLPTSPSSPEHQDGGSDNIKHGLVNQSIRENDESGMNSMTDQEKVYRDFINHVLRVGINKMFKPNLDEKLYRPGGSYSSSIFFEQLLYISTTLQNAVEHHLAKRRAALDFEFSLTHGLDQPPITSTEAHIHNTLLEVQREERLRAKAQAKEARTKNRPVVQFPPSSMDDIDVEVGNGPNDPPPNDDEDDGEDEEEDEDDFESRMARFAKQSILLLQSTQEHREEYHPDHFSVATLDNVMVSPKQRAPKVKSPRLRHSSTLPHPLTSSPQTQISPNSLSIQSNDVDTKQQSSDLNLLDQYDQQRIHNLEKIQQERIKLTGFSNLAGQSEEEILAQRQTYIDQHMNGYWPSKAEVLSALHSENDILTFIEMSQDDFFQQDYTLHQWVYALYDPSYRPSEYDNNKQTPATSNPLPSLFPSSKSTPQATTQQSTQEPLQQPPQQQPQSSQLPPELSQTFPSQSLSMELPLYYDKDFDPTFHFNLTKDECQQTISPSHHCSEDVVKLYQEIFTEIQSDNEHRTTVLLSEETNTSDNNEWYDNNTTLTLDIIELSLAKTEESIIDYPDDDFEDQLIQELLPLTSLSQHYITEYESHDDDHDDHHDHDDRGFHPPVDFINDPPYRHQSQDLKPPSSSSYHHSLHNPANTTYNPLEQTAFTQSAILRTDPGPQHPLPAELDPEYVHDMLKLQREGKLKDESSQEDWQLLLSHSLDQLSNATTPHHLTDQQFGIMMRKSLFNTTPIDPEVEIP